MLQTPAAILLSLGLTFSPATQSVIHNDNGGDVYQYVQAYALLRDKTNDHLKFTGRCASACTVFLSFPKDRICVTPDASFHVHYAVHGQSANNKTTRYHAIGTRLLMKYYPQWLKDWIKENPLTLQTQEIPYSLVRQHIQECI